MTKKKDPSELLPTGRRRIDGTTPESTPADPSVVLQLTITTSQRDWMMSEAKRRGMSASALLRSWIEENK